jgi:hypothetical protein
MSKKFRKCTLGSFRRYLSERIALSRICSEYRVALELCDLLRSVRSFAVHMIVNDDCIEDKSLVLLLKSGVRRLDAFLLCFAFESILRDSVIREAGKLFCDLENTMRHINSIYGVIFDNVEDVK